MSGNYGDCKALVQLGCDRCAGAYAAARRAEPGEELPHLAVCLPNGAHVLDIGCGAGIPIARALAARFHVTGIDRSGEQIRLARNAIS